MSSESTTDAVKVQNQLDVAIHAPRVPVRRISKTGDEHHLACLFDVLATLHDSASALKYAHTGPSPVSVFHLLKVLSIHCEVGDSI